MLFYTVTCIPLKRTTYSLKSRCHHGSLGDTSFFEEELDNPPSSEYRFKSDTATEQETLFFVSSEDEDGSDGLEKQERLRRPPLEDRVESDTELEPTILYQIEDKPISHEELATQVDEIYDGLVLIEEKCVDMVRELPGVLKDRDPCSHTHTKIKVWKPIIECYHVVQNPPRIHN